MAIDSVTNLTAMMTSITWLGPRTTWADFPADLPRLVDAWRCLPLAVMFLLLRWMSDRLITPILIKMVEMSDLTDAKKERFIKAPHKQTCEPVFHFMFYMCSFVGNLIVLWNKPWLWDTKQCWIGWPNLDFPRDVYWLYMVELGFYISQLTSILVLKDHQKKDKTVMVVHHVVTMLLLCGSLAMQCHRIGTLVLLVHDMADPFINLSKALWETGWKIAAERVLYPGFTLWVISRNIIYPFWIISSVMFESQLSPAFGLDMGLWWWNTIFLNTLFVFHVWWTWLFVKIILQKLTQGEITHDEFEAEESEDDPPAVQGGADGDVGKVKVN